MSVGPILHIYKCGRKTELHTDACKQGYGAILLQEAEDGKLHPVYYMSKKTNTAEEKRLCKKKKELITRIARWALQLEEFDYEIEHRAGSRTVKHVDALSRYPVMIKVIVNCVPCILAANKKTGKKEGFLNPISKESIPLSTYHVDFIGRLPSTNKSYQHIFTVVDAFTKFTWLYPVKTVSAGSALEKLKQQQKTFGNPIRITSDRVSAFTSKLFNDYCDEENIQHLQIATCVPRGNGQVEQNHRTLIPVLTKLSLDDSTKWYKYVDRLQRILNSTISRSTKWTPFELLVGIKMRNKEDILIKDLLLEEMAKELLEQREFLRNDAKKNIETLQSENRKTYNKERKLRYTKKDKGVDSNNGDTMPPHFLRILLAATLNESRSSDECALILGQLEDSNLKLREYPHRREEEQRSLLNHLSDLIDEARFKFAQKRKSEIAQQSSALDQQIAAWGLPSKPIENPFQVVLNKKTRKNSQTNDSSSDRSLPKKARTENVPTMNKFTNLTVDDPLLPWMLETQAKDLVPKIQNLRRVNPPPISMDNVKNQAALLKHLQDITKQKLQTQLLGSPRVAKQCDVNNKSIKPSHT
ncbi:hypothetical protein TNCV_1795761 [Trichonephila clavipes]|nr:hypothetical protein TNCV_1795761 [Trichonephila clavipes]